MDSFVLQLRGKPQPQPRQRHRIVMPKGIKLPKGTRAFVQSYLPRDSSEVIHKQLIRDIAQQRRQEPPLDGPLLFACEYQTTLAKQHWRKTIPVERRLSTLKPDIDNLGKLVMDALNGIVWHDDCQVAAKITTKWIGGARFDQINRVWHLDDSYTAIHVVKLEPSMVETLHAMVGLNIDRKILELEE